MASLWKCRACSTAYEVGWARCPECKSTSYEEITVPKATTAGPSNQHEVTEPVVEAVPEPEAEQGAEEVSEDAQGPVEPVADPVQDKTDDPVVGE